MVKNENEAGQKSWVEINPTDKHADDGIKVTWCGRDLGNNTFSVCVEYNTSVDFPAGLVCLGASKTRINIILITLGSHANS